MRRPRAETRGLQTTPFQSRDLTTCLFLACAVQRRRFPVGESPTRQSLQPEAIGAVMEVTKWLKPSISVSRIGESASVQAATRVNAEQASKRTMRRSTRQPFRGRLIRLDEMGEEYVQTLRRCWTASIPITHLTRGAQISIAPAARLYVPLRA